MKILIVDKNVQEKYSDIIEHLEIRDYNILIVDSVEEAMNELVDDKQKNTISGMIIGMDIPIKKEDEHSDKRGGENLLRRMTSEQMFDIKVLIYSEIEARENYINLITQMKSKEDMKKFNCFLEALEKGQQ